MLYKRILIFLTFVYFLVSAFTSPFSSAQEGFLNPPLSREWLQNATEDEVIQYQPWQAERHNAIFFQTTEQFVEYDGRTYVATYFLWRVGGRWNSSEAFINLTNPDGYLYPVQAGFLPNGLISFVSAYRYGDAVQVRVDRSTGQIVDDFVFSFSQQAFDQAAALEATNDGWPSYVQMLNQGGLRHNDEHYQLSSWVCLFEGNPYEPHGCQLAALGVEIDNGQDIYMNVTFAYSDEYGQWHNTLWVSLPEAFVLYDTQVEWSDKGRFNIQACTLDGMQHTFEINELDVQYGYGPSDFECDGQSPYPNFPWD